MARFAAAWTLEQLTTENRGYLRQLPQGPIEIDARMEICHGAPFDEDHYIFDGIDAQRALDTSSRQVCLFGHTHLPVVFMCQGLRPGSGHSGRRAADAGAFEDGTRYLINPGSVGQPRDGDPRAAFAFYDDRAAGWTSGASSTTWPPPQRRISRRGCLQSLANRLAIGR